MLSWRGGRGQTGGRGLGAVGGLGGGLLTHVSAPLEDAPQHGPPGGGQAAEATRLMAVHYARVKEALVEGVQAVLTGAGVSIVQDGGVKILKH